MIFAKLAKLASLKYFKAKFHEILLLKRSEIANWSQFHETFRSKVDFFLITKIVFCKIAKIFGDMQVLTNLPRDLERKWGYLWFDQLLQSVSRIEINKS